MNFYILFSPARLGTLWNFWWNFWPFSRRDFLFEKNHENLQKFIKNMENRRNLLKFEKNFENLKEFEVIS